MSVPSHQVSIEPANREQLSGQAKRVAEAGLHSSLVNGAVSASTAKCSVAFLVSHSSAGGAQEIWANLAEGFASRGYDTRLMALYPYRSTLRESAVHLPWNYVVPERPASPGGQLKMLRAFVRFFGTTPPDVMFTAMPAANVLAPLAAKLAGAKTRIATSHHSPVGTYNWGLNVIDGWIGAFDNVKAVISVSRAVESSLDNKSGAYRAKRRVIYNALPPRIETHLAQLAARRTKGAAEGRRVVATGRLAPQKNYSVLIRAAVHMPDVEIQIVGNGPDELALKELAWGLGVSDRVTFLGHRAREEALEILAAGNIFTQPSLFEGHSLALIEAAKLGLPLVVSDVPVQIEGITALDGKLCGVAVGIHDDKALASEILRLLDDSSHYEATAALALHLAQSITYDAMMDEYEQLAG